jgi:N-succinyldiaminopimelate aminotransferase
MSREFEARRDQLCAHLSASGLAPIRSHGGYFVLADTSRVLPLFGELGAPEALDEEDWRGESEDFTTCRYLIKKVGVGAIPPTVFFSEEHKDVVKGLTRFAFCKTEDVIDAAGKKLRAHFEATKI